MYTRRRLVDGIKMSRTNQAEKAILGEGSVLSLILLYGTFGGQCWDCTIGLAKYFDEQSFFFLETESFNRLPVLCILVGIILPDETLQERTG